MIVRSINRKKNKGKLFGPYPNASAAREIVNMLNRIYPLRKCNTFPKKPCLYYHIGECLGYCTIDIPKEKIDNMINEIVSFFNGDYSCVTKKIEEEMYRESNLLHFEKAKELKDLLDSINVTLAKQKVEINDKRNIDIFGYYENKGYIAIQVLFIRGCKIIERHKTIMPLLDDTSEQLTNYIATFYDSGVLKPNLCALCAASLANVTNPNLPINCPKPPKLPQKSSVFGILTAFILASCANFNTISIIPGNVCIC